MNLCDREGLAPTAGTQLVKVGFRHGSGVGVVVTLAEFRDYILQRLLTFFHKARAFKETGM